MGALEILSQKSYIIASVLLTIMLGAPQAQAIIYHARSDCGPLPAHIASADVEARSGYNQHGDKVAPADLASSQAIDTEPLKHPSIDIDLPINSYINAPSFNADLARTDIHAGQLKVGDQGELNLDGKVISSGQQTITRAGCTE